MTHTLYWGWKLLAFLLKVLFRVKPRLTLSIWQACWILCCYVMSRETQQRPGQALSTLITTFIIVPNTSITTTTNKINEWTKKVVIYIHWCSHEPKNAMAHGFLKSDYEPNIWQRSSEMYPMWTFILIPSVTVVRKHVNGNRIQTVWLYLSFCFICFFLFSSSVCGNGNINISIKYQWLPKNIISWPPLFVTRNI